MGAIAGSRTARARLCYPLGMAHCAKALRIRIVAPAGPVNDTDLLSGAEVLKARGHAVQFGAHAFGRFGYLAGSDDERLSDLQEALDDPGLDVVWFARGGFGTTRLLPRLSCAGLAAAPKTLAGYSDATALHAWAQRLEGARLLYAPSVQELGREGVCQQDSLWVALDGEASRLPANGPAAASGPHPVAGGCLSLLTALVGTPWAPEVSGRWLFLEDVGEPLYRLDRMMTHLAHAGWFERCAGVLLGSFRGLGEGEAPADVASRALELLGPDKPLVTGLPVGHTRGKHTMPLEVPARWDGREVVFEGASRRGVRG